jgi:uncharacterized membrane protein
MNISNFFSIIFKVIVPVSFTINTFTKFTRKGYLFLTNIILSFLGMVLLTTDGLVYTFRTNIVHGFFFYLNASIAVLLLFFPFILIKFRKLKQESSLKSTHFYNLSNICAMLLVIILFTMGIWIPNFGIYGSISFWFSLPLGLGLAFFLIYFENKAGMEKEIEREEDLTVIK